MFGCFALELLWLVSLRELLLEFRFSEQLMAPYAAQSWVRCCAFMQ
jgi:hypothetical protein